MDRKFESGAVVSAPTPPVSPSTGYASNGDPATGVPPTILGDYWYHMITEELHNLITSAGLTPAHTNLTQVRDAVSALIVSSSSVVPVGGLIPYTGIDVAPGYLKGNGAAISRATYAALFNKTTIQDIGDTTIASPSVINIADTSKMATGMPISGPGIPAATTVLSIDSGTSITLSINATATASAVPIVVAPHGVGDGATTFNVIETRGEFLRGWDDARGIDSGRALGSGQGDQFQDHKHLEPRGSSAGGAYTLSPSSSTVDNNGLSSWVYPTGVNVGSETRPRNRAVQFLVKY